MQDVTTRKKFHFFFRFCPQNSNPQGNWLTFEKFNRWNKRVQANASYLGSCNVAVQEISQVRKENISNEQKKKDYSHTQVFNGKFQISLAMWIERDKERFELPWD